MIVLYILEYLCFALLVDSHSLLYHHDPPRPFTIQLSFNHQMGDRLSMEERERERERRHLKSHGMGGEGDEKEDSRAKESYFGSSSPAGPMYP